MSDTTVSGDGMDGETFFSLLNGRLDEAAMKVVAAAFAETMGRGGLAYVRGKTGLSRAVIKKAVEALKGQPRRGRRTSRACAGRGETV